MTDNKGIYIQHAKLKKKYEALLDDEVAIRNELTGKYLNAKCKVAKLDWQLQKAKYVIIVLVLIIAVMIFV